MALSTVLLLAAGMGVSLGFQDPTFNMQFAIPEFGQNTSPVIDQTVQPVQAQGSQGAGTVAPAPLVETYVTAVAATVQGKKVSAQFKNAKVSEVLDWMQGQGISFVIAEGMVPSDARITLNIVDQPAENVIDAIGSALGGHWAREKGIRVFRQGHGPVMFSPGQGFGDVKAFAGAKGAAPFQGQFFAKDLGPDFQKKMELMAKDHEKEMQKRFGPEFQKKMEQMAKDHEKEMQKRFGPEFQKKMELMAKDHEKEMQKRFGPEFQKKMEQMAKEHEQMARGHERDMQKRFGPDFQRKMEETVKVYGLTEKDRATLLERARKNGSYEIRDGVIYRTKDGKTEKIEVGKDGIVRLEDGTVIRTHGTGKDRSISINSNGAVNRNVDRVRARAGRRDVTRSNEVEATKFLRTLTSDQKHSMRTRGFIYYNDLTREQREMLGKRPEGRFEIKMKVNNEEVVIKGS